MDLRALCVALLLPLAAWAGDGARYVRIPAGSLTSALAYEDVRGAVKVASFQIMRQPVTNAQFAAFVAAHPQWQREAIAPVFADKAYLAHWPFAADAKEHPVTNVSWFAATAYCEAQGARLPRWFEWEYVAAAAETRRDARRDPAWRERILAWYATPASRPLPRVGEKPPNAYGVQDLHGVVWEWTEDYSAMLVSVDNRNQDDAERNRFCGVGALSMADREHYAVLMRVAMLSALSGSDTTRSLGFRCAKDVK